VETFSECIQWLNPAPTPGHPSPSAQAGRPYSCLQLRRRDGRFDQTRLEQARIARGVGSQQQCAADHQHDAISYPMFAARFEAMRGGTEPTDRWHGPGMRVSIFYGTESACACQYGDLELDKYGADDDWRVRAKGLTACQARVIAKTMCALMDGSAHDFSFTASCRPARGGA
jgi:hypothetical protein